MKDEIKVAVYGAGEMGRQALHYLRLMNYEPPSPIMVGWFDDTKKIGEEIEGFSVLGGYRDVLNQYNQGIFNSLFIAIGYNHLEFKLRLVKQFKPHIPLFNIIAKETYVDSTASIGNNIMIYPGAIVDKEAIIEDGVVINLGCIVSHNSRIGACSFLAPRVTAAGFSDIGSCSFLGVSSTVIDNLSVCSHIRLGAGAVITDDIKEQGLYIGIPAHLYGKS